ncbi:MAG: LURP-one-related family protein [Oscillospiraceae bacterium]|nr:LURP-one-related family protein [Oscillospiraceae bacterium]
MKLYIKQKAFSWRDKFFIKDEWGSDRYYAQGELFAWGRKLHLYDMAGNEAAFIRQKMLTWRPRYYIELGGHTYGLVKEITFLKQKYFIEGLPWGITGDFLAHEYEITDGAYWVMRLSKHWFTWGDSYEVEIRDPRNELLCLCIVLGIDCVNADAAGAAAASG